MCIAGITQPDDNTVEALRARCEEQAAYIAQVGDVTGQLNMAVTLLVENKGGDREYWNGVISCRLLDKSNKH